MVLLVYMILPPVYVVLPIYIALLTHVPYLYQPDLLNMLIAEFCVSDEVLAGAKITGGGGRCVCGRGGGGLCLAPHYHHQNDSALRCAAVRAI